MIELYTIYIEPKHQKFYFINSLFMSFTKFGQRVLSSFITCFTYPNYPFLPGKNVDMFIDVLYWS